MSPEPPEGRDRSRSAVRRGAIGKAVDVLAAFEGSRASLSLTELSTHTGVPLSTTHRIVGEFVEAGFCVATPMAASGSVGGCGE